jgi:hypothetical protein
MRQSTCLDQEKKVDLNIRISVRKHKCDVKGFHRVPEEHLSAERDAL